MPPNQLSPDVMRIVADLQRQINELRRRPAPTVPTPNGVTTAAGKLYLNAAQTLTNNTTTTIACTQDSVDAGLDSVALGSGLTLDKINGRIGVTTSGTYLVGGQLDWVANSAGWRIIEIRRTTTHGTHIALADAQQNAGTGTDPYQNCSALANLLAGDYIELRAAQTSGGNLDVYGSGLTILWCFGVGVFGRAKDF